jgi:hypothetical protein
LNTQSARNADSIGARIAETGKYVGTFTQAHEVVSKKGTKGIEFSFKDEHGQTADYLTLWTVNAEGKELRGLDQLNAIMTCLKLRDGIKSTQGGIEKFDAASGQKVTVQGSVFPDLLTKKIGLLLQLEEYQKSDGSIGSKMAIFMPFEASTEFTSSEILDRATKPVKMQKAAAFMKDKKVTPHADNSYQAAPQQQQAASAFIEDDIPF